MKKFLISTFLSVFLCIGFSGNAFAGEPIGGGSGSNESGYSFSYMGNLLIGCYMGICEVINEQVSEDSGESANEDLPEREDTSPTEKFLVGMEPDLSN